MKRTKGMDKKMCKHEYRQYFGIHYSSYVGTYHLEPDGYYCIYCMKRVE